jgi:hypothetical protein
VASKQVDAVVAALERETAKAAKSLILEIDANLRKATPVDTGHARASWLPSIGAPATDEPSGRSDADHATGVAAVLGFKLADGALYESNNAPYIQQLNLGSSTKAPVGFVETAIDQAQATIQSHYDSLQIDVTTSGAGTASDDVGGAAAGNLAEAFSPL